MPRQFGDGQHRQEAQHPPDTHGLLARKLFRAFARTVPKEEQLTNASAALPSMDMPARAGCYRRSFDEHLLLSLVNSGREIGHGNIDAHNPERPLANVSYVVGADACSSGTKRKEHHGLRFPAVLDRDILKTLLSNWYSVPSAR
jgi:hypothetical protein